MIRKKYQQMRQFAGQCWNLTAPFWQGPERNKTVLLLAAAMLFNFFNVYMTLRLNIWSRDFFNAMENKDITAFFFQLGLLFVLAGTSLVLYANQKYLCGKAVLLWRRYMSSYYAKRWLTSGCCYSELFFPHIDNPDQRIAEDLRIFPTLTVSLVFDFVDSLSTLGGFAIILWGLSESYSVFGIVIPGVMLWLAFGFVIAGTYFMHRMGHPLIEIDRKTQEYEADYRYNLLRVREHAKEISLYTGQPWESKMLIKSFANVFDIWLRELVKKRQLNYFNFGYAQISGVVPYLLAAPKYFGGIFKMGELMQTVSAFNGVRVALSWFILNYPRLSEWKATLDRLTQYNTALSSAERCNGYRVTEGGHNALQLKNVSIYLPSGETLTHSLSLHIAEREKIVLTGPSGVGKTTLLYVLRNIWPFGTGEIFLPASQKLFLSQNAYLPPGSLYDVLTYPDTNVSITKEECRTILNKVELEHVLTEASVVKDWGKVLSPGEQQRIALARIWVHKPDWIFLDEALSSVDPAQKERIFKRMKEDFPAVSILSIEHYGVESDLYDRIIVWNEWLKNEQN